MFIVINSLDQGSSPCRSTQKLKIILIEDLAYFLGKYSDKFTAKLKEFNLF